tara:strand:- start:2 stop:109 length:108 start_codon:yes stop_codon:yes gene_type:complete
MYIAITTNTREIIEYILIFSFKKITPEKKAYIGIG